MPWDAEERSEAVAALDRLISQADLKMLPPGIAPFGIMLREALRQHVTKNPEQVARILRGLHGFVEENREFIWKGTE